MSTGRETFMRRAIELSRRQLVHAEGGGPFGAVVVKDGAIIGEGWNQVVVNNDPSAHAEVVAIRAACRHIGNFSLAGADIYTSCEPCPMCLAAILWARIGRIFYANTRDDAAAIGFDDAYFYREVSRPIAERDVPSERLLTQDARAVFDEWVRTPGRAKY